MDQVVGKIDILRITFEAHAPALLVRVGMVADPVSGIEDPPVQVGVHLDVLTQHEEGCLGIILVQRRENPLGDTRRGTVVERKEHPVGIVDLPDQVRHEPPDYFRWFQTHGLQK